MIAMLISGAQDEYACIKEALEEKDYNVVQYSNFLKAFDNLEEISPNVIIINTKDYPRHWKILAFIANSYIYKKIPMIILVPESFTGKQEADEFSVLPFVYEDADTFNKHLFFELLNSLNKPQVESYKEFPATIPAPINNQINYNEYFDEEEDFAAPTVEELLARGENDYISHGCNCSFVFMNPAVMSIITGKVISFVYPEICFLPDRKEGFQSVYIGQIFDDCSLKTEIGLSSVKACVTDVTDTITLQIC